MLSQSLKLARAHRVGFSHIRGLLQIPQGCWPSRSMTTSASHADDTPSPGAPQAALMVIGDEILAGNITDTNTPWLAKLLHSRGVDLVRVEYIPDNKEDIKDTVWRLRQRVGPDGFIFTSGGIGPTHDDVTYESLASAFGAELKLHEATVDRMREAYAKRGVELNEARLRMATLPTPAEVMFTPGTWVPLVNLQGVYILPGIPKLFQSMISAHQERFSGTTFVSHNLYTLLGEGDLADKLTNIAEEHAKVNIGSYPNVSDDPTFKVKITVSARDPIAVHEAITAIKEGIPGMFETQHPKL